MPRIQDIPEIQALDARRQLIRIPVEVDVPVTPRVRRIIDTAEFRRLSQISQLGLVSLVYPAAHHTRFEHSLGVYRMGLRFLKQLAHDGRFSAAVSGHDAERLIVAALLHDIGHWPFCHPIEDIRLPAVPQHESFATSFIHDSAIATLLREDWGIEPAEVTDLLAGRVETSAMRILKSLLSGPIDIDKMDYLARDSLHAGVPYGRNFDEQRLIGSLCLNAAGDGIAITNKGRTASEMMVFSRYVMFSEVYWHHAVRSATAMLQRGFYALRQSLELENLFRLTEQPLILRLQSAATGTRAESLLEGLFGAKRQLYKRLAEFSFYQEVETYQQLARRPYPWLVQCAERFSELLSNELRTAISAYEVLFDAPPQGREVEFNVEVFFPKEDCFRQLGDISPAVQALALRQFDDYVKRVRIFVHPRLIERARSLPNIPALLKVAVDQTGDSTRESTDGG